VARIIVGEALRVLPGLGKFALIVTDPPYSLGANRREWRSGGAAFAALYEATRHLKPNGTMIVFCGTSGTSFDSIRSSVPLPLSRILSWHKPHVGRPLAGPFGWQSVLILVFGKCGGATRAPDNIRAAPVHHRKGDHPAELPPAVCEWLAVGLQDRSGHVLDPFCGTAALLVPFLSSGLPVTGIEIDHGHAALAAARLRTLGNVKVTRAPVSSRGPGELIDGQPIRL